MLDRATKTDLLALLGTYVLAHGWLLLNNGLYWDDWEVAGAPADAVRELFRQSGYPLIPYYHLLLDGLGVPAYRISVFLSYLASALCLYAILGRIPEIDRKTKLVLVLLFALFPVNSARISIVSSWFPVCYALFFIGFWLAAVYLATRVAALRVAALALLFASFLTPSLLVFYAVVLIYIAYQGRAELKSPRALPGFMLRHLDFLLLPIVFWALRLAYFQPYGTYRGYNRVTLESAVQALAFIDNAFFGGFIDPLADSFHIAPLFIIPAAIAAILGARLMARIDGPPAAGASRRPAWWLASGFVFFVMGVFPYLAVGKVPSPDDWDSRHQLLTPLGASLILVYLPRLALGERGQNLVYAALVLAFLSANAREWFDFQKDWYKQVALIENFKISPEIERGTHFLIDDRTADLDANGRRYRPYEYAGLFRAAFRDRKRLGRRRNEQGGHAPEATIVIEHGALQLTLPEVIRLRVLESRNEHEFRARVKRVVRLSVSGMRS